MKKTLLEEAALKRTSFFHGERAVGHEIIIIIIIIIMPFVFFIVIVASSRMCVCLRKTYTSNICTWFCI